jgi:hypothetical protein
MTRSSHGVGASSLRERLVGSRPRLVVQGNYRALTSPAPSRLSAFADAVDAIRIIQPGVEAVSDPVHRS